jgi:hypothetical protein
MVVTGDERWWFDSQSSLTCEVVVGHSRYQWRAAEDCWVSVLSRWCSSSRPIPTGSIGSSGGVHHLRVGWLSFDYNWSSRWSLSSVSCSSCTIPDCPGGGVSVCINSLLS